MKKFYVIVMMAIVTMLAGCSKAIDGVEAETAITTSEISIGLPINIKSRTAMDSEGRASWTEGDAFMLWAENRTGGFNINGEEFGLKYYWHSFKSAVFTTYLNTLKEGTYTYYAVSPTPESVSNYKATYNLPTEQQGNAFDGAYDIMVATPLKAKALSATEINNLSLEFNHKMHILKMEIPQNGNPLNNPISRVVFTFPTAVTGNFSVNVLDPIAAPIINQGSTQLAINIPEGFDEGERAWGFILPSNLSGSVSYYAISTTGERTTERSFKISKECLGGHITPLSLTIPDPIPPTILRVKVGKNNLGEAVQTVTIYSHEGKELGRFAANSNNYYDLIQHGIYEDGLFQTYTGRTFTVRFESEHAIVEKKITIPSTITKYTVNTIATIDVPYLFFEDFSSIHTSFEKDDARVDNLMSADGMLLNNYMSVAGWNGAHIKGVAGKGVRVNVRHQSALGATRTNGRLDSPAMKGLKPGANVTLKVEFDMGAYANSGYGKNNDIFCTAGVHTSSEGSALNGIVTTTVAGTSIDDYNRVPKMFSSVCLTTGYLGNNYNNDSFGSTFPTYSFTASGCSSATRFGWVPCCVQKEWVTANNAHYYIYLDNIKVSIIQ